MSDKLENFERAFSTHSGGCRRTCNCGREFYNPNGGWDWEEGEIEALDKSGAISLDWSVSTLSCEGKEYVMDCDCWHKRAKQIMGFIDGHAQAIAEYLTLEKKRKQTLADESPVVTPEEVSQ